MPKIIVAKAFNLILRPGDRPQPYAMGVHDVSEEVAEHWYTKEHLAPSGEALATQARAAADAAFHRADAAVNEYERLEEAARQAELDAGLEPSEPVHRRLRKPAEDEQNDLGLDTVGDEGDGDSIAGGAGNDSISADAAASDTLQAGAGDDTVQAGAGNDTIDAGAGGDTLTGGQGNDVQTAAAEPPAGDAPPKLTPEQEKALDRDGDGKAGGAPKGGNRTKSQA